MYLVTLGEDLPLQVSLRHYFNKVSWLEGNIKVTGVGRLSIVFFLYSTKWKRDDEIQKDFADSYPVLVCTFRWNGARPFTERFDQSL